MLSEKDKTQTTEETEVTEEIVEIAENVENVEIAENAKNETTEIVVAEETETTEETEETETAEETETTTEIAEESEETEGSEEKEDEKERRSSARFYAILLSVLTVILLCLNFWSSNYNFVLVSGASMDKTLYDGEYLLSYKVVNPEYELKRGDIIVVDVRHIPEWNYGKKGTAFIIKRLIGLEGDIVRCEKGELEICYAGTWNETMDEENYPFVPLDEPYAYYEDKTAACNTFEYVVGEGEIFFLGDNRNHSSDSRYLQMDNRGNRYSQLQDRLYKINDVSAVVPSWALKRHVGLEKYLVRIPTKIKNAILKPFR
ncbi:MAG: signal peptidase I [Clostridiales bacterium]|nr:signal peptidase I [Clostridiales bacterium]